MKGLYIYMDFTSQNNGTVGIIKKIQAQRNLFDRMAGEGCDLVNLPLRVSRNKIARFFSYVFSNKVFDLSFLEGKRYDFVYVRRINPNCKSVLALLRKVREANPGCKIVYEIPTYPYDFEHNTLVLKVLLFIDRIYRKHLRRYVDRIATLTDDKEIFGCKTLKITNGVDCASIPVCGKTDYDPRKIHLIAVAQFSFWHGYERAIEGLHNYGKENVVLHLVGDGPELEKYKGLVSGYGLERQVIFHGALSGDALTAVFDTTDIALCSLSCHKIYIYIASELKSREYLCRGLPIVTSTKIDIVPDDFDFALRVPEDDSALDIQKIVDFVESVYVSAPRVEVRNAIRAFAERTCSMDVAMRRVVEYLICN